MYVIVEMSECERDDTHKLESETQRQAVHLMPKPGWSFGCHKQTGRDIQRDTETEQVCCRIQTDNVKLIFELEN